MLQRDTKRTNENVHLSKMISAIAWILWAIVGLNALWFFIISISPAAIAAARRGDLGGRRVFRFSALIWLVGIILTVTLPISKFHLVWIYPLGAMAPYAIMRWRIQRQLDMGTGPFALLIRQHLEEQSGGEVWSWPEMLRVFKVYESTSPHEYTKIIQSSEFAGWWVAQEPGVGEVKVIRRADNVKGTLLFKDSPRFYFCWSPDCADIETKKTSL